MGLELRRRTRTTNAYVFEPLDCGVIALTVLLEPTITVRVKVALAVAPPTASWRPPGVVWKVSCTVLGSSRSVLVVLSPPESVAVSLESRYDGYSWSGAVNDPPATPGKL